MEFVLAGKQTDILTFDKIISAYGTRQALIDRICTVCRVVGFGWLFTQRRRRCRLIRDFGSWLNSGLRNRPGLQIARWLILVGLQRDVVLIIAELDYGQSLQHRASDALGPALPRPAHYVTRPVPFRMAMGANRADTDDDEEKCGNDTGDAVQNDHCNSRGRRFPKRICIVITGVDARLIDTNVGRWVRRLILSETDGDSRGGVSIEHGVEGSVREAGGGLERAAGGPKTIEHDGGGLTIHGGADDLGRTARSIVCGGLAIDVANGPGGDVIVGAVRQLKRPRWLDILSSACCAHGRPLCWRSGPD